MRLNALSWLAGAGAVVLGALFLGTFPAAPAAAQTTADPIAPPGVCWTYTVEATLGSERIPDRRVAAFCLALRTGVIYHLRRGDWSGAEAKFLDAERAAMALPDDGPRAMALDEARAARALAVEQRDWQYAAELLEPARNLYTRRDVLALTRAFFHVRHGLFAEAARDFHRARADLPRHWCPEVAAAATAAAADNSTAAARQPHLPSYLEQLWPDGTCTIRAMPVTMPAAQSYRVSFASGRTVPTAGSQAALQAMAAHIQAQERGAADTGTPLRWVVIGHTDHACWEGRWATCRSDNRTLSLERAQAVRDRLATLLHDMNVRPVEFRVEGRGMDDPIHEHAIGVADARNRRVHLVPEPRTPAPPQATAQCPWEVVLHHPQAGADVGRQGARVLSEPLAPGAIIRNVPGGKAYFTLRHVPSLVPAGMRFFHIVSESRNGGVADLAARAGLPDRRLSTLAARGGRLLEDGMVFATDDGATEETLHLYISDRPLPLLDAVRDTPAAPAGRLLTAGPRTAFLIDDAVLPVKTLAAFGATKEWNPQGGSRAGLPGALTMARLPATPPTTPATALSAAVPIPVATVALPEVAEPVLKSGCTFTFLLN